MTHGFEVSRLRAFFLFVGSVFFLPALCWFIWNSYRADEYSEFLGVIVFVYAVFCIGQGVEWFHRLKEPGLALTVDENGIFDPRSMSRPIAWSEIEAIEPKVIRSIVTRRKFVNLRVKDPTRFRNGMWRVWYFLRGWKKWYFDCDFSIGFIELNGDIDGFLEAAAQSGQSLAVDALEAYRRQN